MAGEDSPFSGTPFTPVAHAIPGLLEQSRRQQRFGGARIAAPGENQLRFSGGGAFLKASFHRLSERHQWRRDGVMNLFGMLELSGSALGAERQRAEVWKQHGQRANHAHARRAGRIAGSYRISGAAHSRFSLALAGGLQREHSSLWPWPRWSQTGVRR